MTSSASGCAQVWKLKSGQCLRKFESAHSQGVTSLAFSREGTHVLSASYDGLARVHGLKSGKLLKEFRGHTSYVNAALYSPDGSQVRPRLPFRSTSLLAASHSVPQGQSAVFFLCTEKHQIRLWTLLCPCCHVLFARNADVSRRQNQLLPLDILDGCMYLAIMVMLCFHSFFIKL